jgi:hypothetical protein
MALMRCLTSCCTLKVLNKGVSGIDGYSTLAGGLFLLVNSSTANERLTDVNALHVALENGITSAPEPRDSERYVLTMCTSDIRAYNQLA